MVIIYIVYIVIGNRINKAKSNKHKVDNFELLLRILLQYVEDF